MKNASFPKPHTRPLGKLLLPILLVSLLTACGFSLRSNEAISSNFPTLYLNLQQPSGEFALALRRTLSGSNISLVDSTNASRDDSIPILNVSIERLNRLPVTVTPTAGAAQYEIQLSINISLLLDGEYLLPEEDLALQRIYFEDTGNISGNLEEVELIESEMRRELVDRLMRRLQTVASSSSRQTAS